MVDCSNCNMTMLEKRLSAHWLSLVASPPHLSRTGTGGKAFPDACMSRPPASTAEAGTIFPIFWTSTLLTTLLSAPRALSSCIFTAPWEVGCYYSHFTVVYTQAHKGGGVTLLVSGWARIWPQVFPTLSLQHMLSQQPCLSPLASEIAH